MRSGAAILIIAAPRCRCKEFVFVKCLKFTNRLESALPVLTVAYFYIVVILEVLLFKGFALACFALSFKLFQLRFRAFLRVFGDFFIVFHNFYFLRYTISTAISAGFTPEILDACPSEVGRILSSFCLASILSPSIAR